MSGLSFGQWIKLAFGAAGLMQKHAAAIPVLRPLVNDALDLWQSVVPPEPSKEPAITPAQAAEKVRTGDMSDAEQQQFDRASQTGGL